MRWLIVCSVMCVLVGAGCRSPGSTDSQPGAATKASTTSPAAQPTVTAIDPLTGKVASVNEPLRFVVLDFSVRPLPPVDQRLNVYRQGRKVGEVKVTGPSRGGTIAADILAGSVQAGDEVRKD